MSTITTVAVLPPAVREYYDRLLLMTAYPTLVHVKMAQKRVLPEKEGDTIVFRRYSRLDTVPVPLQDGISPPGAPLSATDIKARVDFYGKDKTAVIKSLIIDLEAYGEIYGDRAQAEPMALAA